MNIENDLQGEILEFFARSYPHAIMEDDFRDQAFAQVPFFYEAMAYLSGLGLIEIIVTEKEPPEILIARLTDAGRDHLERMRNPS